MQGAQPNHPACQRKHLFSHWVSRGHVKPRCPRAHDRQRGLPSRGLHEHRGAGAHRHDLRTAPCLVFPSPELPKLCITFSSRVQMFFFPRASSARPVSPLMPSVPSTTASERLLSCTRSWRCNSLVCPLVRNRALWCAARAARAGSPGSRATVFKAVRRRSCCEAWPWGSSASRFWRSA